MISILQNTCPSLVTDRVHKLISLLSSKHLRIVQGPYACVDANHTVYLPPLPKDATEKDFIRYFHLGTHEQSHIEGGSDFNRASKDPIKFRLENALEDIRCEQHQEQGLPGLVPYRIKYYSIALEEFANKEMLRASFKDIVGLIGTLGKYIIIHARKIQLQADQLDIKASPDLLYAYDKYVSDLEDRIISMTTLDQMFELADIIYDRIKDLIRENNQKSKSQQGDSDDSEGDRGSNDQEETSSADSEDTESNSESNDSDDDGDQSEDASKENDDAEEDNGELGGDDGSDSSTGSGDTGDGEPEPSEVDGSGEDDEDTDSGDGEPDKSNSSDPQEIDQEEIDRELQRIIDELNDSQDSMDFVTDLTEQINQAAQNQNLPYMVCPDVKDVIAVGNETTNDIAESTKRVGLNYLGPKGSQITKLFVSQSNTRTAYNQYSGTMDVTSVVSDVHDNRDDVYRRMIAPRLDKAAVTFLIDNSGSMTNTIGHIYAILSGLMHYLSRACIPTEAIGYTAEASQSDVWRDAPAHLTLIKQFHEQYNGTIMRRCIPPAWMGQTNDLDGLKFAVPRIWARPERKKIIFILCDGEPNIGSYLLDSKLIRSYIEYIEVCRKAGIVVFGIGINRDLTEFFGKDNFASVDLSNVGAILIEKLTKILNKVGA